MTNDLPPEQARSYDLDHEGNSDSTHLVTVIERDDRRWWPYVVSVGASLLSAALAVVISIASQQRSEDKTRQYTCAVIVSQDDNYREAPPATETGRRNAASMRQLRVALGCPMNDEE
jgi:hypothetical protein